MMTRLLKYPFICIIIIQNFSCQTDGKNKSVVANNFQLQKALEAYPSLLKKENHKVLSLGTFHFDSKRDASDIIAKEHIDITSERNQNELNKIVERLVAFNPKKIAVEWRPQNQKIMDSLYGEYVKGNYVLGKHETFQIGFRVAKKLGLSKVYCIDNNPPFADFINSIDDWEAYADSIGHLDLWRSYDIENQRFNQYMDTIQKNLYVQDYLKIINSRLHAKRTKELWTTGLIDVDHNGNYLGADVVARWYRRNIRLFSSAKNLVEHNENLLIIYGGAHKWILDELFEASPEFEVVQFNDL